MIRFVNTVLIVNCHTFEVFLFLKVKGYWYTLDGCNIFFYFCFLLQYGQLLKEQILLFKRRSFFFKFLSPRETKKKSLNCSHF